MCIHIYIYIYRILYVHQNSSYVHVIHITHRTFFGSPEVIIIFLLIVSIILVNLLVAQLNQAYQHVYTDMQGHVYIGAVAFSKRSLEG